jgi:hypothetical protein
MSLEIYRVCMRRVPRVSGGAAGLEGLGLGIVVRQSGIF